jgi:hypothetical protein
MQHLVSQQQRTLSQCQHQQHMLHAMQQRSPRDRHTSPHVALTATHPGNQQNCEYLWRRGLLQQRLAKYREAVRDYSAALPLLQEAGLPVFETLVNRGICYR